MLWNRYKVKSQKPRSLCFITVFPGTCTTFNGPHSVECLNEIWTRKGCLEVSDQYPEKLEAAEVEPMKTQTIT